MVDYYRYSPVLLVQVHEIDYRYPWYLVSYEIHTHIYRCRALCTWYLALGYRTSTRSFGDCIPGTPTRYDKIPGRIEPRTKYWYQYMAIYNPTNATSTVTIY